MKCIFDNPTRIYSSKGQLGIISRVIPRSRRGVILMLIILEIASVSCSRPQQASSGGKGGTQATGTPVSSTPIGNAGGAVLKLERYALFFNGQDEQHEVGAIQLKFSETTEGPLVVEGTGKTEWSEITTFPNCSYKVKTETTVTVYGLYDLEICEFSLTINVKFPPSATSYENTGACDGTINFNNQVSSEVIKLHPPFSRSNNSPENSGWWQTSQVEITDITNDKVKNYTNCIVFLTPVPIKIK